MGFFRLPSANRTETDSVLGRPPFKPLILLILACKRERLNSSSALLFVYPASVSTKNSATTESTAKRSS
jgi:hypothetical protein